MRLLLGIDVGTQGTKAALYDEAGARVAEAFEPSRLHRPGPGIVEENPEEQVGAALRTTRECVQRSGRSPGDIAALAAGGQMAGIIGVGRDGRAVTPYDSWLDTRCSAQIAAMQGRAGDEVLEKCGNAPSFNHGPKVLWWREERRSDYERVRTFVQPGGYVAMRLCGLDAEHAFIDHTYLHFSGFADTRRGAWDAKLCQRFQVDPAKLPQIVAPQAVVGEVAPAMAEEAGLRPGTPVVAGCGDTAASFLAAGAIEEGICVDVAGTASVFAATTRSFVVDTRSRLLGCGRSAVPGLWHPYAYVNGGGQNLEWFRRELLGGKQSLEQLDLAAASAADDERLPYFLPHLGGRVSPAWPKLRGAWANLSWDAGPSALYRALLEGVALEYALYRNAVVAAVPGYTARELRVTGGGQKSATWNQLKADRLQIKVAGIEHSGGAPMGAALLAGYGAGVFPDLAATARRWARLGPSCSPDPAAADLSARRVRKYAALLSAVNSWSESD